MARYTITFFRDQGGDEPVYRWLTEELSPVLRRILGFAMNEVLQEEGVDVCGTEYGRQLGDGLFEFRIRGTVGDFIKKPVPVPNPDEKLLLRIFCHAHGDKVILLLAGYDKLANPSRSRQDTEIELARMRLRAWKLGQKRAAKAVSRRRSP